MIELLQFPWSPFCLVQRRILDFSGHHYRLVQILPSDRSKVWKLTKHRYYQVPVLKDGPTVIFEVDAKSQVIAKYLDAKLNLSLFHPQWDGLQRIVWQYIEGEIEAVTFKLNDAHYLEFVPPEEQLAYLRFKERKFGPGCLDDWLKHQGELLAELTRLLTPFEQMLAHRPFLLENRPRFIDFDLWGMLSNMLYSGHYAIPDAHPELQKWHVRLGAVCATDFPSENIYPGH